MRDTQSRRRLTSLSRFVSGEGPAFVVLQYVSLADSKMPSTSTQLSVEPLSLGIFGICKEVAMLYFCFLHNDCCRLLCVQHLRWPFRLLVDC